MSDGQFVSFFMNETDEEQLRQTSYGEAGDILTPDIINGDPDGSNASLFSNRKLSWDDSNAPKICSEFTVIRTAMRFDSGLCAANYNDRLQTEAYLHFLVAIANQWFTAPGLCLKIEVCNIKGHCNGFHGSDEFRDLIEGAPSDCRFDTDPLQSLLFQYANYMYPEQSKPGRLDGQCDITQLFYGRNATGMKPHDTKTVGCALLDSICLTFASSVQYVGFFNGNAAIEASVLAHELGHALGARHIDTTPDRYIMEPTICQGCTEFSKQSIDSMKCLLNETMHRVEGCTSRADATYPPTSPPTFSPTPAPTVYSSASPTVFPTASAEPTESVKPTLQEKTSDSFKLGMASTASVLVLMLTGLIGW